MKWLVCSVLGDNFDDALKSFRILNFVNGGGLSEQHVEHSAAGEFGLFYNVLIECATHFTLLLKT